jgi:hypothetical protein
MTVRGPIFTKLVFAGQLFVKGSYAEFHENPTSGLVDTRLQTERRAWWSPLKAFFVRRKERLTVGTQEAG